VSEFVPQAFLFTKTVVSSFSPSCHVARPTKDLATDGLPDGVCGPCLVHIHSFSMSLYVVPLFITILTVWSGLQAIDSMTLRICRAMRALPLFAVAPSLVLR